jgi:hypothetical protein
MKRDSIRALAPREKARLDRIRMGEAPGSERSDEEERMFAMALREGDRCFYEGHRGLGNSQKAEAAWLEAWTCGASSASRAPDAIEL